MYCFRPGAGGPGARGGYQGRIIEVGYIIYIYMCVSLCSGNLCYLLWFLCIIWLGVAKTKLLDLYSFKSSSQASIK